MLLTQVRNGRGQKLMGPASWLQIIEGIGLHQSEGRSTVWLLIRLLTPSHPCGDAGRGSALSRRSGAHRTEENTRCLWCAPGYFINTFWSTAAYEL